MILPRFLPAEISAGPWVSQGQSQVSRPLAQPPFRTAYATRHSGYSLGTHPCLGNRRENMTDSADVPDFPLPATSEVLQVSGLPNAVVKLSSEITLPKTPA